eukprot:138070-Pleurochrysis_carterae.AAC.1
MVCGERTCLNAYRCDMHILQSCREASSTCKLMSPTVTKGFIPHCTFCSKFQNTRHDERRGASDKSAADGSVGGSGSKRSNVLFQCHCLKLKRNHTTSIPISFRNFDHQNSLISCRSSTTPGASLLDALSCSFGGKGDGVGRARAIARLASSCVRAEVGRME